MLSNGCRRAGTCIRLLERVAAGGGSGAMPPSPCGTDCVGRELPSTPLRARLCPSPLTLILRFRKSKSQPFFGQNAKKECGTHNQKQDQIQELDQNHKPGLTACTPQHRLLRLSIQQSEGAL